MKRILILGSNGMLGSSLFRYLTKSGDFDVLGTVRNSKAEKLLNQQGFYNLCTNIDVANIEGVLAVLCKFRPNYVLNCVGIIKQSDKSKESISSIKINSLLPHQLAEICGKLDAKLVHFSTDCVFSGRSGNYKESDSPDPTDFYGKSKLLGEVNHSPHLTLRTSIIGHELCTSLSLIDWFLRQNTAVNGYTRAIFSGVPTIVLAEFLKDYVFGKGLSGVYHLSSDPIDKFTLLQLVNEAYLAKKEIIPFDDFVIDRSLNSDALKATVGFSLPEWPELIYKMRGEFLEYFA